MSIDLKLFKPLVNLYTRLKNTFDSNLEVDLNVTLPPVSNKEIPKRLSGLVFALNNSRGNSELESLFLNQTLQELDRDVFKQTKNYSSLVKTVNLICENYSDDILYRVYHNQFKMQISEKHKKYSFPNVFVN